MVNQNSLGGFKLQTESQKEEEVGRMEEGPPANTMDETSCTWVVGGSVNHSTLHYSFMGVFFLFILHFLSLHLPLIAKKIH